MFFRLLYFKAIVEPKLPALAQLADGLDVRGLINLVKKNPIGFAEMFIKKDEDITVERFLEEVQPSFSEKGSNKFSTEESIFKLFCDYIEQCFYDGKCLIILGHLYLFTLYRTLSSRKTYYLRQGNASFLAQK